VFVTHDQIEAMTMADKIVVMNDGLIEQIGSPLDLYDTPVNLFVASFIGSPSMNLIPGTVRNGDGLTVESESGSLPLTGNHSVADGQPVVYGIRPEHLELAEDGIAARVAVVEPTGLDTMVVLRHGGGDVSGSDRGEGDTGEGERTGELVAMFRERHEFKPGETVHLRPRAALAHIFDRESGKRL
jgi:multiple sugar transport system ATP-binding protein